MLTKREFTSATYGSLISPSVLTAQGKSSWKSWDSISQSTYLVECRKPTPVLEQKGGLLVDKLKLIGLVSHVWLVLRNSITRIRLE